MNLSAKTADTIASAYRPETLDTAIRRIIRQYGMSAFTDEARREIILKLGMDRRLANRMNAQNRKLRAERATPALRQAAE